MDIVGRRSIHDKSLNNVYNMKEPINDKKEDSDSKKLTEDSSGDDETDYKTRKKIYKSLNQMRNREEDYDSNIFTEDSSEDDETDYKNGKNIYKSLNQIHNREEDYDSNILTEDSSEDDDTDDYKTGKRGNKNESLNQIRKRSWTENNKIKENLNGKNSSKKNNNRKLPETPAGKKSDSQNFTEVKKLINKIQIGFKTESINQNLMRVYKVIQNDGKIPPQNKIVSYGWKLLIILSFMAVAFYVAFNYSLFSIWYSFTVQPENKSLLITELDELSLKHPNQHKYIWTYFNLGIERLTHEKNRDQIIPAIYFIIQWSNLNNTALKISEAVGNIAAKHISISDDNYPLSLSSKDINLLERGELISKFSKELEDSHVIIVNEIEKIVPNIAQDLRYYCDEEYPLVRKAAIFLIMNIEQCNDAAPSIIEGDQINAIIFVEKCLRELWGGENGLDDSVLDPLIIRVVTTLLQIRH